MQTNVSCTQSAGFRDETTGVFLALWLWGQSELLRRPVPTYHLSQMLCTESLISFITCLYMQRARDRDCLETPVLAGKRIEFPLERLRLALRCRLGCGPR